MNETVVLQELQGGLWHTTPPSRFQQIVERVTNLSLDSPSDRNFHS